MLSAIRRLIQRYGFFKREPVVNWLGKDGLVNVADWKSDPFYSEETRASYDHFMREVKADAKNQRLAQIARERDALKEALKKAVKQKKARSPIYQALRALSVEELRVETGK